MSDILHHHSRIPQRVRNELRFRQIAVTGKTLVAGNFWRVDFSGPDLVGFVSPGFDDHIKVFFPDAVSGVLHLPQISEEGIRWPDGVRPRSRDYTPLSFDSAAGTLTLDFFIHDDGVASQWAEQAKAGDVLGIGGPRGSLLVPEDYHFQLYICDESGLPAFRRRKQTMEGHLTELFAFTDEATGTAYLEGLKGIKASWLGQGAMQAEHLNGLLSALDTVPLPTDDYFIWITGEGEAVKKLSDYFIEHRGCDATCVRAVAYWHQK